MPITYLSRKGTLISTMRTLISEIPTLKSAGHKMLCTSHGPSRSAAPLLLKHSEMRTAKRPTERYGFGARALPKAYEDSGYGRVLSGPEADSRSRLVLERTGPEADVARAGPVPAQTWCKWAQSPAQSRRRCGRGGPSRSAGSPTGRGSAGRAAARCARRRTAPGGRGRARPRP
jgi:hypothetical protein